MLANTNYAQQERLQLGHMLKPLPMPRLPRSHSYLRLPFGPVDHLALQSTESRPGSVCVCVVAFDLEEGWFMGSGSVFISLLIRIMR